LQIRQTGSEAWTIEGRAWNEGEAKPTGWPLGWTTQEAPITGQASVVGSPFSGEPIEFDDLRVRPTTATGDQSKSEQLMK